MISEKKACYVAYQFPCTMTALGRFICHILFYKRLQQMRHGKAKEDIRISKGMSVTSLLPSRAYQCTYIIYYLVSSHPVLTTIHCEIEIMAYKPQLPALIVMKVCHQSPLCILLVLAILGSEDCALVTCMILFLNTPWTLIMYLHDNKNFFIVIVIVIVIPCYFSGRG